MSNRQKKSGPRKEGPTRKVLCVCGWRVLPENMEAHRALGNCDPIDLSTYSAGALMGCVQASDDDVDPKLWDAAYDAELVGSGQGPEGEWWGATTKLGDRVLAALRAKLEGLVEWELEVLMRCVGGPSAWGAAVGAAIDALQGHGLMNGYHISPIGRAALALHDREHQP